MRYLTHRQREVAMWLLVVLLFTADCRAALKNVKVIDKFLDSLFGRKPL